MLAKRWFVALFTSALAGGWAGSSPTLKAAPPAQADQLNVPLPRYHLAVGQELVYRSKTQSKSTQSGQAVYTSNSLTRFQVVAANPQGGWHVIEQTAEGSDDANPPQPRSLAEFDLWPDGRIAVDPAQALRADPSSLFPQLPTPGTHWQQDGWQGTANADGESCTFHLSAAATTQPADQIIFTSVQDGMFEKLYQWKPITRLVFDLRRGLLLSATMHCDEPLYHRAEDMTIELTQDTPHPATWAQSLAQQAAAVLAAKKQYSQLMDAAEDAGDTSDARMNAALAVLQNARNQVSEPALLAQLAAGINDHAEYVHEIKDDADRRAALVGKPAPLWELHDLQGNTYSLARLRGQVVVLDFWYRGCGWCMRAMPQMKQLAEDFRGKPVAIFGMNVDSEDKDARFVADFFKLPYPTLRSQMVAYSDTATTQPTAPSATYRVQGYPTLFVIGPDGILRDIHVGYSPTLHEDVARQINQLLNAPAAPTGQSPAAMAR